MEVVKPWPWPIWADLKFKDALTYYDAALKAAAAQSPAHVIKTRQMLAENDLFFLMTNVMERQDMVHPWLFSRSREFQKSPNGYLDLWSREHGKSSLITCAGTIFEIIRDPEVTIGIFSHSNAVAKKFLSQIKSEFENRSAFNQLWPDIFHANPRSEAQKWSEDGGIIVKRKGNPKEATVEAHGLVDGQPIGRHFKIRMYDDIVTPESVSTPAQIQKTTEAWQMSDNLGTEGGIARYTGTRYHMFDTYSEMIDAGVVKARVRPCTVDGTVTGMPVLMSRETLDAKRVAQGPYIFASQMLLNPIADAAMGFKDAWKLLGDTDYTAAMASLFRVIICDPARSKKRNNNDYTTFFVLGYGADTKWRVLDIIRDKLTLSGRGDALFRLHRKWKPHRVGYEEYGIQADIEHYQDRMARELYTFEIIPLCGQIPKRIRILKLVPYFESGRIFFPTSLLYKDWESKSVDLVRSFFNEEYTPFPVLKHDDMLDCLARLDDPALRVEAPSDLPPPPKELDLNYGLESMNEAGSGWLTA